MYAYTAKHPILERVTADNPAPIRKIIHVDMDAFYASVEQRDNPGLRGKPVAVGGSAARGVVAAASYEARAFGVRSAMPSSIARRQCPDLIFTPPRFEVYKTVSQQIRQIFARYTPLIEPLSLDEAYLDVTENLQDIPTAFATAREIRQSIFAETGLTASAGISYNKFLAKLASNVRKPNGQFAILPQDGLVFIEKLAVGKFHGIGPATNDKMRKLGILTGADLKNCPVEFLQRHFGKAGLWYYNIARGDDQRPVRPDRQRKSYGSEKTFGHDLTELAAIEQGVLAMAADVWAWCDRTRNFGRTLTVKIKFADFKQITRSHTALQPIISQGALDRRALTLVHSIMPIDNGIRLLGVTLSGFGQSVQDTRQLSLLPDTADRRT